MEKCKVLVTGADGFIGSHLVEDLLFNNFQVTALSYYNSFNFWGHLESLRDIKNLRIVSGDIRDSEFIDNLVKGHDVIIHLASLIAIPYSYIAPMSYVDVNVKGTLNICQSAKKFEIKRLVHISTSEVYGSALYTPIDESHPLKAQSPYSATKIAADALAMSFYHSFQLPVIIARPFNVYGPRQSARAIIPTIISQLLNNKEEIMLGDTSTIRDFTYVKDTCRALRIIAESEKGIGEVFNIGSGVEVSILELFEKIKKLSNKPLARIVFDKNRVRPESSEVKHLLCNHKKISNVFNFSPEYDLENGLIQTIEWFNDKNNLKLYKTEIYNV
jgi:NAD dependent epimerase/dehydratase